VSPGLKKLHKLHEHNISSDFTFTTYKLTTQLGAFPKLNDKLFEQSGGNNGALASKKLLHSIVMLKRPAFVIMVTLSILNLEFVSNLYIISFLIFYFND